jgi:hypothetical protein
VTWLIASVSGAESIQTGPRAAIQFLTLALKNPDIKINAWHYCGTL